MTSFRDIFTPAMSFWERWALVRRARAWAVYRDASLDSEEWRNARRALGDLVRPW